jgi:hypothetical protein
MFAAPGNHQRVVRQSLLSIVMLGVLLASVGAAWLIVRGSKGARERGAQILRQIRSQKLTALWGQGASEDWYLGKSRDGQPVGWCRATRQFTGDGYAGTVHWMQPGLALKDTWRLNQDATSGTYLGQAIGSRKSMTTRIVLQEGQVLVQSTLAKNMVVRAAAPSNYVPEGLEFLVGFLASAERQAVACQMVFNEEPIRGGRLNFHLVMLESIGSGRVRWQSPDTGAQMVYQFDKRGILESIESPAEGITYQRVSRQDVEGHFPDAGRLVGTAMEPSGDAGQDQGPGGSD